MTKITVANAIAKLQAASAITLEAYGAIAVANTNAASALDMAVAAIVEGKLLNMPLALDVKDRAGNVIEHIKCKVSDYSKEWKDTQGKTSRATQSAMRVALLASCANITDEKSDAHNAVYVMITRALTMADAINANGLSAKLDGNKLVVTGKNNSPMAKALKEAETATARLAIAKPSKAKGSDKRKVETPTNAANDAVDLDTALGVVAAYTLACMKHNETPSPKRLSALKAIMADVQRLIIENDDDIQF